MDISIPSPTDLGPDPEPPGVRIPVNLTPPLLVQSPADMPAAVDVFVIAIPSGTPPGEQKVAA
jgi:hypothetical protein